ncbi:MAG: cobalt-precorrin-6A reductase [Rhodospirillales bacterium]|nr:cobalt-precorrin-6A reductase [Rhodospirillales bacterium]
MPERVLILGGTGEAATLAERALTAFAGRLEVTTSLAGRLARRPDLAGRVRVGGFGGVEGLLHYLTQERIERVIDATHPFAATISANAADACARAGVPRLMLIRPEWQPRPGDRWVSAASLGEAALLAPSLGRRVFLAVGSGGIGDFAGAPGVWFLVRLFQPSVGALPLAAYETIIARPPFTFAGERDLLAGHRIDLVIAKNSGGTTDAKLAAARELGLPVLMVRRPLPPWGESVGDVGGALTWLAGMARP